VLIIIITHILSVRVTRTPEVNPAVACVCIYIYDACIPHWYAPVYRLKIRGEKNKIDRGLTILKTNFLSERHIDTFGRVRRLNYWHIIVLEKFCVGTIIL